MNKKFSRIIGVGITVAVLASLLVAAVPASAGTLSFSNEFSPPTRSGATLVDIAAAKNGTTIYAAGGSSDLVSNVVAGGTQMLAKSTNGGSTWSAAATPKDTAASPGWIGNLPSTVSAVTKVVVAPDTADGSFVAILTSDSAAAGGQKVYTSADGGSTWSDTDFLNNQIPAGSTIRDIAVAGPAGAVAHTVIAVGNLSGAAKVWYFQPGGYWIDATGAGGAVSWNATGFGPSTDALAVDVSPNVGNDFTFAVVTVTTSNTTTLQFGNLNSRVWNGLTYGLTGQGITVTPALTNSVSAASVVLAPTFYGFDQGSMVAYVGIADVDASTPPVAGAGAGLFRVAHPSVSNAPVRLASAPINSVALNAAGDKLVAGAFSANYVYRVATPASATLDSAIANTGLKRPGVGGPVIVAYAGSSVVAATPGAFSKSNDDGKSFNDISLINTSTVVMDFAVPADGSKIYVVTGDSATPTMFSLWRKATAWERVLVVSPSSGIGDMIVRLAPENSDVVFLAEKGGSNIYYSNDGGNTSWQLRVATVTFADMAPESATVQYAVAGNQVLKSDNGFIWNVVSNNTFSGNSIQVLSAGNILVTGTAGQVAYIVSGNVTSISSSLSSAGPTLAAASGLASGNFIFATATSFTDSTKADVYRWTVGTSTAWTAMGAPLAGGNPTGIAYAGGALYVSVDNGSNSYILRTLTPGTATTSSAWSSTGNAMDGTTTLRFGNAPDALQATVGADKAPKVWALDYVNNKIYSYTDILVANSPAMTGPADKFSVAINTATGGANNVVFQWSAIAGAPATATYDLQIALDANFTQVVSTTSNISGTMAIVGPTGTTPFPFQANTTYYWRVRENLPLNSPWTTARSFVIEALQPLEITAPANGASNVPVKPTFVWSPVRDATTYEIVVSDDPTFKIITFSRTTDKPLFASDEQLAYGTVYYWRVRASAPATAVTAWVNGVFTTEGKPAVTSTVTQPPFTITTQPAPTITVEVPPAVEAIPAYLLWIIIGIGAILVIALIVLIVRTRRVS